MDAKISYYKIRNIETKEFVPPGDAFIHISDVYEAFYFEEDCIAVEVVAYDENGNELSMLPFIPSYKTPKWNRKLQ